jgi:hypothetical protein
MFNATKHPFNHAGAGRTDRLLKALMPSNVAIDTRDMADLMVFAARFGKVIKYWDTNNKADGDWSYFWESDYLFFLATVAGSDRGGVERTFQQLEESLLEGQAAKSSPQTIRADTLKLVQTIRQLAVDIATWGQQADVFPTLQQDIAAIVRNSLQQPLRALVAYAKDLSNEKEFTIFISDYNAHPFAKEWNISQYDYEQNIDFNDPMVDYLAAWQSLRKIFRRFVIAHERISKQATKYLETTQNDPNRRQHPPHIVLFMSFLHLFKHLQNQLNALPEKHLDYYYNDILHLQNRREIPDHAHLVFQLARNVYQQTLPVGTLFRAGKTPDGKDMFYALERPLTLNQAQVVEVKTLLVQNTEGGYLWENTLLDADKDTDAPDKMKEVVPFRPLGKAKEGKKAEVGFAISSAMISKSKSDRRFTLNFTLTKTELDTFTTNLEKKMSLLKSSPAGTLVSGKHDLLNENLKVEVSSKDTWVVQHKPNKNYMAVQIVQPLQGTGVIVLVINQFSRVPLLKVDIKTSSNFTGFNVVEDKKVYGQYEIKGVIDDSRLTFTLEGYTPFVLRRKGEILSEIEGEPNVVLTETGFKLNAIHLPKNEPIFNAPSAFKNNKSLYNLTEPAIKFSLTEDSYAYEEVYSLLATTNLKEVEATIEVKDLTDFDIYEGSINRPLGHTQNVDLTSVARQGGLIVRCDEAFKKGLNNLTITFVGKAPSVAGNSFNLTNALLFVNGEELKGAISGDLLQKNIIEVKNIQKVLNPNQLEQEKLDAYFRIDVKYNRAKDQTFDVPVFADANISYTIAKDLDKTEFFHLSSHGGHEAVNPKGSVFVPPFINPESAYPERVESIPKIVHSIMASPDTSDLYRGNLYIGVKDIPKLGILSLLFQVADGTEVDLDAFPPNIEWSYLSTNETEKWQLFPASSIVFDSTKADENSKRSLVQSGVIEFQMPKDLKIGDTVLNANYYWIRASALETGTTKVGALPSLVGIYAQAGRVELATSPIDAGHFDQPLPPTTIAQLKFREAAVRLIEQPYESFGGRAAEQGAAYHLRISERLRHKKRAITAWDYEHLVLEQFPEVRFVKCINHSGITDEGFSTRRTGAVAVVVMPLKTTQPLQPKTNRAMLENIKSYLKKYSNGFTSFLDEDALQVIVPDYQEVVVSLNVKFHAGDTEKLVHNLDKDIARFIALWAFDSQIEPGFGKNLYKTELLSQIEALDYVDFIEDLYITDKKNATIPERIIDKKVVKRVVVVDADKEINGKKVNRDNVIVPSNTRTLLTSHQLDEQTPFETNHSITPIFSKK